MIDSASLSGERKERSKHEATEEANNARIDAMTARVDKALAMPAPNGANIFDCSRKKREIGQAGSLGFETLENVKP